MSKHSPDVRAAREAAARAAGPKPVVEKQIIAPVPDFAERDNTFAARIVGCLRSGMSVPDSIRFSAGVGWVFSVGDNDRKGVAWKWPGPEPFILNEAFVEKVIRACPFATDSESVRSAFAASLGQAFDKVSE